MKPIIVLLTRKKLFRQTEQIAGALVNEIEYSRSVDEENEKLLNKIQQLEDKIDELYKENDELHASYMQLLDSNRSFEFLNDLLEGELEYYKQQYGDIDEDS